MRALERFLLLQIIDQKWREHLYDMDYLREGIHLRGFAQIDPLVAYKNEGFSLFQDLMNTIWSDFARMIYNVEVEVEGENGQGDTLTPTAGSATGGASFSYSGGTLDDQPSAYGGDGYGVDADEIPEPAVVQQRRVEENEQIGRNDPCWCGSGKKFKKCHGA
jgi:preprotein translocase subunit SecA